MKAYDTSHAQTTAMKQHGTTSDAKNGGRLSSAFEAVTKALRLTLPMAKGYAAQHKVGSNAKYIEYAEEQLALAEAEMKGLTTSENKI